MANNNRKQNQRLTRAEKEANDKQWYKDMADLIASRESSIGYGNVSDYRRMKVNYDLMNNKLNVEDFEYVCKPFGSEAGELPAKMVNRDIVSGKIKSVLGMEMKRPFAYKAMAVNQDATTRREQEEFNLIKEYVINSIVAPIRKEIELKFQEEQKGQKLNPDEMQQVQQQIAEMLKAKTPVEVKKYMTREYQDPAEVLSHQLLEYFTRKFELKKKFNDMFKHAVLSAKEVAYVGILNNQPQIWVTNSLYFNCDKSSDLQFIEDGEWATCKYRMTRSKVVEYFGDELTDTEIDSIYTDYHANKEEALRDSLFTFEEYEDNDEDTIIVTHSVWKSLKQLGFLTYKDKQGKLQLDIVDESYRLNLDAGDVSLEWEWIPAVYEAWQLQKDIYKKCREIPGQFRDIDNVYHSKLPYYGAIYDNMNSQETSLMDRLKQFQYYYNIVMYRMELLLASDKGKKVLMNINAIPDSAGINIKQWQYFMESTPYMWYDMSEEGATYNDANTVAKVVDLSLVSDIQKYIEIAEYLRTQCGRSVGITDNVEGQTSPNQSVGNAQQDLEQSSNILEPYFELHNHVKKNVLQALIDTAKIAYSENPPKSLSYVLDDMSRQVIDMDVNLLNNSTIGIFVENAAQASEVKELIKLVTHAAMQNQTIEMSDVIATIRQQSVTEAEETLKVAEQQRRDFETSKQTRELEATAEENEKTRAFERERHQNELEKIRVKGEEDRKTDVVKTALLGASFNPDQDKDNDGINDFIEIAKHGLDAVIKSDKNKLDREKFEHQKKVDDKKMKQEDKKIALQSRKSTSK